MSYFNDLQFLDLDDVSKEEADEIHNILYPIRSCRSVVFPWVEDHVDWSQQSSYEGETSECSEGGDCYQTTGPPGAVPLPVPVPTSIHQVYPPPPPPQVVSAVQLSYLPPTGYYQPQHHQVYDGSRRRNKASPKRSGSSGGGNSSNMAAPSSGAVAQGNNAGGGGSAVTPYPPPLAQYPYHPTLVPPPPPPAQYSYIGTGMGPAQHATGHPLFLTPQIPVYTATPHIYSQYPPHQQVYPGMHGPPQESRSPKTEEPTGHQQPPPPSQHNDIDVGSGGMGGGRSAATLHMVVPMQQPHRMDAHPPSTPPPPAQTPTSTDTHTIKTVESGEQQQQQESSGGSRQPKSLLPPINAIKTTALPPSASIKSSNPSAKQSSGVMMSRCDVLPPPSPSPPAPPPHQQTHSTQQPIINQTLQSGSVATPVTPSPLTATTTTPVQPEVGAMGPPPLPSVSPQSASVPTLVSPPPTPPATILPPKPTWAALVKGSSSHQHQHQQVINSSPTVAESMLGGNKGPKALSKGPPPQNAVVITPPPSHLVAPAVHSGHHSSLASTPANTKVQPPVHSVANSQDPILSRIADVLSEYELEHRSVVLTPRGLNNPSNYCYINATLQALLACAPFYNLIKTLAKIKPPASTSTPSPTPVIDSMIQFVSEFSAAPAGSRLRRERGEKAQARREGGGVDPDMGVLPGSSFEPVYVYKMVHSSGSFLQLEGKQEDAEEFLTVLLNGLNDEMTELLKLKEQNQGLSNGEVTTNGDSHHSDIDNTDWKEVMNMKGVSRVTRRTEVGRTPLTDIFMGQMRSRVARSDPHLSTDNIQPFYSLQLDVENCNTVVEALDRMASEKAVEGGRGDEKTFTSSYIDKLPVVLILHLKCFYYSHGKPTKLSRSPDFPIDLKLEPKLLQSNKSKQFAKATSYKLFAVVYHEGKEATKGHYLADVYNVCSSTWIRYDDAVVKAVSEQQVLNPKPPRVPYLLLYRRMDKTNNRP